MRTLFIKRVYIVLIILLIPISLTGFILCGYFLKTSIKNKQIYQLSFTPELVINENSSLNPDFSFTYFYNSEIIDFNFFLSSNSENVFLGNYDPYDYIYMVSDNLISNINFSIASINQNIAVTNLNVITYDENGNDLNKFAYFDISNQGVQGYINHNSDIYLESLTISFVIN